MASLTTIEGIGEATRHKLGNVGIGSVEKLLGACLARRGRLEITKRTNISADMLLTFVNHADLMRVESIGGEYSELLEAAGVDSVPELAQRTAANLRAWIAEVNPKKKLVRRLPSESQFTSWVARAGKLGTLVTH